MLLLTLLMLNYSLGVSQLISQLFVSLSHSMSFLLILRLYILSLYDYVVWYGSVSSVRMILSVYPCRILMLMQRRSSLQKLLFLLSLFSIKNQKTKSMLANSLKLPMQRYLMDKFISCGALMILLTMNLWYAGVDFRELQHWVRCFSVQV